MIHYFNYQGRYFRYNKEVHDRLTTVRTSSDLSVQEKSLWGKVQSILDSYVSGNPIEELKGKGIIEELSSVPVDWDIGWSAMRHEFVDQPDKFDFYPSQKILVNEGATYQAYANAASSNINVSGQFDYGSITDPADIFGDYGDLT